MAVSVTVCEAGNMTAAETWCRTPNFRGAYLPPQIEPRQALHIFGKPRKSTFQRFLRNAIPSFLEEDMHVSVTVRETEPGVVAAVVATATANVPATFSAARGSDVRPQSGRYHNSDFGSDLPFPA